MRAGAFVLAAIVVACATGRAATFVVDATADEQDLVPGDGACSTASGACSLRAAIQESNALAGADELHLGAGLHALAIPGRDEDAGLTGDLDVRDALTLIGAGRDATIVSAAQLDRVLDVRSTELDVRDLTLRDGRLLGGVPDEGGGIVHAAASGLTLTRVRVTAGDAGSLRGGGVLATDSHSRLESCEITGNTTALVPLGGVGGGLASVGAGDLVMSDCVLAANSAAVAGGAYVASGVIERSTIRDNVGGRVGGLWLASGVLASSAIVGNRAQGADHDEHCAGVLVEAVAVSNVTVSANFAASLDGTQGTCAGVCAWYTAASTFDHVTITDNRAAVRAGGYCDPHAYLSWMSSSIIAGNDAPSQPDVRDHLGVEGVVLIGDADGVVPYGTGTIASGPANLRPLADNGGPTSTHALGPGSVALDAVGVPCRRVNGTDLMIDQRGLPRPMDGPDLDLFAACDLGALEAQVTDLDRDGDTVPDAEDCAPLDADTWAISSEPTLHVRRSFGLSVALEWDNVLAGTSNWSHWDVASGELAELPVSAASSECRARGTPVEYFIDRLPPSSPALYYLVRPFSACSPGWGASSLGVIREACP